jgi:hypothetical protein
LILLEEPTRAAATAPAVAAAEAEEGEEGNQAKID